MSCEDTDSRETRLFPCAFSLSRVHKAESDRFPQTPQQGPFVCRHQAAEPKKSGSKKERQLPRSSCRIFSPGVRSSGISTPRRHSSSASGRDHDSRDAIGRYRLCETSEAPRGIPKFKEGVSPPLCLSSIVQGTQKGSMPMPEMLPSDRLTGTFPGELSLHASLAFPCEGDPLSWFRHNIPKVRQHRALALDCCATGWERKKLFQMPIQGQQRIRWQWRKTLNCRIPADDNVPTMTRLGTAASKDLLQALSFPRAPAAAG